MIATNCDTVDLTGILVLMTDVTRILSQIESGDPSAAEQLLPLVYDELRKLAAAKLAHEKPGQTLQATALVHEAYLRLVDVEKAQQWDSRGHFFAAAAEAMRRILVDQARRKASVKRGGALDRIELAEIAQTPDDKQLDLIALDEALTQLGAAASREGPSYQAAVLCRAESRRDRRSARHFTRNCPAQMGLRPRVAVRADWTTPKLRCRSRNLSAFL